MINPDDFIPGSQYFRYREFIRSATANVKGIDNAPTDASVWANVGYLVKMVLDPLREVMGPLKISSGYRSYLLNRAVGGSVSSFHSYGMAADVQPMPGNPHTIKDIFVYVYENLPYTELIAEDIPDGWVHVAIAKGREKEKQLKYKLVGGSVRRGTYQQILGMFK